MSRNWQDQRVLVIGAARQGLALARYLCSKGALVTLNDQSQPEKMSAAREALAGLPVEWVLGGHPLELLDRTDWVCISGGVPLTMPIVMEAVRRGLPLTNDSQIFMEAVPCPVAAHHRFGGQNHHHHPGGAHDPGGGAITAAGVGGRQHRHPVDRSGGPDWQR